MSKGKAKLLTRDQILAASDLPSEYVKVPEWGGTVRVQGMTVAQRNAWEASHRKFIRRPNGEMAVEVDYAAIGYARQRLVAMLLVDEDGNRIFTDADVAALETKSAAAMERVVNVAHKLNGVSQRDIQELEGNSAATADADSSSDLLSPSVAPSLN